ncbi:MAG: histidinol-phosphate transaminase [Tannerellaceae bacterium]|jgi:histidinol-phosphate aminotransferase|nr:histidinol-phosphate transaminase [Tannerellaceae bacterium]
MNTSDIQGLLRKNICELQPYSSARHEFHGEASIYLDANENPHPYPYSRYPDPFQRQLKAYLSEKKGIEVDRIFLGNGSDEVIDLLIRAFCDPCKDNIITLTPSYGMYEVAAQVNDVECIKVSLADRFQLNPDALLHAVIPNRTKIAFLCSPNNPTGNLLDRTAVRAVLENFPGIVVVDEAYIDFASAPSMTGLLDDFPRLVVMQTLSKAWGAAGIRLGMAFASSQIVKVLSRIKIPYNISQLTLDYALAHLADTATMERNLRSILAEREMLRTALSMPPYKFCVYPSEANYLLVDVGNAQAWYHQLVTQGIVVRNRSNITMCEGCLRITVGTPEENKLLLQALQNPPAPE